MIRPIRLAVRAEKEIALAMSWYEQQQVGLERAFLQEIEDLFDVIARFPNGSPRIRGTIRQCPARRFPFVVLYAVRSHEILVYRVFHTKQHPRKKLRRR